MSDHDSIYHRLFSHPEMVAELLRDFLDAAILAELELSGMKRLNTKFTAMTGHRRRGDMVMMTICNRSRMVRQDNTFNQ
ncbi:MAG: hypothetical protein HQL77_09430 [Magnetococcales bacterium]|nr:hypothetical protein [Magnetococcales bacterium]